MSNAAVATATEPIDQAGLDFEALYRSSRDDVYAYLLGLLRDRSAAEEVTAQAFERAWRRRRQLDLSRGSPRSWLFGIARNAGLDELRRRGRSAPTPEHEVQVREAEARGPGDPAGTAIDRAVLRQAVGVLSGRERELVALKYFAGLSNSEIGTVIGTTETNAGTRLHRVLEKLRRALDEAD